MLILPMAYTDSTRVCNSFPSLTWMLPESWQPIEHLSETLPPVLIFCHQPFLMLQSAKVFIFQDYRSLAIISCSSISFCNVCQFHGEKINLWFCTCHHFPSFSGLTRKPLHLPTQMLRLPSILQNSCVHSTLQFLSSLWDCLVHSPSYIYNVYFHFA